MIASQAGIISSRRKKINPTEFNNFRYTKVEYNNPVYFTQSPPGAKYNFTARHIYNYNKNTNSFTFLGVQKAQSLKRIKSYISEFNFYGSTPSSLDGVYTRDNINSAYFWKDGIPNSTQFIQNNGGTDWDFIDNNNIFAQFHAGTNQAFGIDNIAEGYELNYPNIGYAEGVVLDNSTLNSINQNRLYNNTNPDIDREQFVPDVNFNINTCNIFDKKNLANNQKVFIDVRWIMFADGKRVNEIYEYYDPDEEQWIRVIWWLDSTGGGLMMNDKKGHIYRAGVIIKDNIIDNMIYFNDLAANNSIIRSMQQKHSFVQVGI